MTTPGPSFLFLQYEKPLGTAVIATATLAALRTRLPRAQITVAAAGLPAELLRESPLIDELIVTPHAVDAFLPALLAGLRLRRRRFDYVVTDGGNRRTKVTAMALASGAARRVGMAERNRLLHAAVDPDPRLSNLDNNLRILDVLGYPGPPAEPQAHFSAQALAQAQTLLPEARGPRIAMVTQTSRGHPNAWFDDRWRDLAQHLVHDLGATLVFLGTSGDAAAVDDLHSAAGPTAMSLAGRTPLPVLAAVLTQCDLAVTIDTGTMHLARAVGTPMVILGNAAQPAHWWLPAADPRYLVLRKDHVPCALCLRMACATRECMQEIEVSEVAAAVAAQLRRYPASAAARRARAEARLSDRQGRTPDMAIPERTAV